MQDLHPLIQTRKCDKCQKVKIPTLDFINPEKDWVCRDCKNEYGRKKKKPWGKSVAQETTSIWYSSKKRP